MPFRVKTGGAIHLILEQEDESEKAIERRYTILGYLGFSLAIIGTLFQMVSSYISGQSWAKRYV
jgi:hypothetical protein